jgi:hypothetical protein
MLNQDNDPPGFMVTVVDSSTDESGATALVQFSLLSQPAGGASVTIPLSISDVTEGSISVSSITILNANWNNPSLNQVVITGVDDAIADGTIGYQLTTGDPTSGDPVYEALGASTVADASINNFDNDTAGFTVAETLGSTSVTEGGGCRLIYGGAQHSAGGQCSHYYA